MDKQTVKATPKSLRGIENCRVVEVGAGDFAECTKSGPVECSHALPFGYCFLCMHPRVEEIIEHSKNARLFSQVQNGRH